MKKISILILIFVAIQCAFPQPSKSPAAEDKVRSYVTDKTETLNSSQVSSLEKKLSAFDKETSNQVVVWMVPSLEGASLEEKSFEIAEQNGIGQKGKNNGVLLFIAKDDRKLRIEVGYGLEGALTDALCDQIIRKEITPQFKKGNFYEGINAGVDAIMKATKGEYTAEKKSSDDGDEAVCCGLPIIVLFVIIIFIFVFGLPILSSIFGWGRGRNNWWWTGGSGGSGWSSGSSSWSGGGFSGGGGSFGGGGSSGSW